MTETALSALRPGLLAYCRRLRPDPADAEDLVQETLLIALEHGRTGRAVADWPRWLAGIARMRARRPDKKNLALEESWISGDDDPLTALLARERGTLLERAFARLDAPTRTLLTARYLDELPVQELAGRLGLSENAASQRLVRARGALEDVLSRECREAAAAHGLLSPEAASGWTTTTLHCPRCAEAMLGRLTAEALQLKCPSCDDDEGLLGLSTAAASLHGPTVLAGAKGFRVALKRVNGWWDDYLQTGLRAGQVRCRGCGRPVAMRTRSRDGYPAIFTDCACGVILFVHPAGLLLHDEAGQTFWQKEEKIRFSQAKAIVCGGRDALLVEFVSRRSATTLEAVYATDTLERLTLRKNS